jgi:hypothetical protein
MKFYVHLREQVIACAQVLPRSTSTERDHVGMLAKQQYIRNRARLARACDLLLQAACAAVGDDPQVHDPAIFFGLVQGLSRKPTFA